MSGDPYGDNLLASVTRKKAERREKSLGYVVADGQRKRFRKWDCGPVWTEVLDDALHFARRKDAEAFAAEDEDAWYIASVYSLQNEAKST